MGKGSINGFVITAYGNPEIRVKLKLAILPLQIDDFLFVFLRTYMQRIFCYSYPQLPAQLEDCEID